jgi:hypothetical protein
MNIQEQSTSALQVPEDRRLDFLPTHFGPRLMMRGEALVYGWLRLLCQRYKGSYWHYYTLSDGGFYMAPDLAERLEIQVEGNGFCRELSADAAGIVATLFALGQLVAERVDAAGTATAESLIEQYHLLRGFAAQHAEAAVIFLAID